MRTAGVWVLTALALGILAALVAFAEWFGPAAVDVGFAMWALASVVLLLAAYGLTRSWPLLALAVLLVPAAFSVAVFAPLDHSIRNPTPLAAVVAVLTASPFLLTIAWLGRLHASPSLATPAALHPLAGWRGLLASGVLVFAGAAWWAYTGLRIPAEEPAAAARYAGCYEVRLGRWIPGGMLGHGVGGIVPARIRLDTTRGAALDSAARREHGERMHEVGRRLIRPGWWGAAYWVPMEGERVVLGWWTGFHGIGMELTPRSGELRGVAMGFTDVVGPWPEPRARVRAVPIDCALVGPDSARSASRAPS